MPAPALSRPQLLKNLGLQTACTRSDADLAAAYAAANPKLCQGCTASRLLCGGTAATLNGELNGVISRVRFRR